MNLPTGGPSLLRRLLHPCWHRLRGSRQAFIHQRPRRLPLLVAAVASGIVDVRFRGRRSGSSGERTAARAWVPCLLVVPSPTADDPCLLTFVIGHLPMLDAERVWHCDQLVERCGGGLAIVEGQLGLHAAAVDLDVVEGHSVLLSLGIGRLRRWSPGRS
jgi:hypothetical protein